MRELQPRTCECGSQSFKDYNGENLDACTDCAQLINKDRRLEKSLIKGYDPHRKEEDV